MAERVCDVHTVMVHKMHDDCGGEFHLVLSYGQLFSAELTQPIKPQIEHRCMRCGKSEFFTKSYPRIEHRELTNGG